MTRQAEAVDPRGHDYLAAAAALGAEQQNFRHTHAVGSQTLRDPRDVRHAPALEDPPDAIQPANRVEHFEVGVRPACLIEMLGPRLGVTRPPHASRHRPVDRGERGINQVLAQLL